MGGEFRGGKYVGAAPYWLCSRHGRANGVCRQSAYHKRIFYHTTRRLSLWPRKKADIGLRLAPVPLPFSTVGPGFGVNADLKYHFTKSEDKVQFALIAGVGGAHVLIRNTNRYAWSPNGAALTTFKLGKHDQLTFMGRYVHLRIPTATGGGQANQVNISGVSAGLKHQLTPNISLLPEVGVYWYEGSIGDVRTSGPGFQYGLMLATSF